MPLSNLILRIETRERSPQDVTVYLFKEHALDKRVEAINFLKFLTSVYVKAYFFLLCSN